MGKVWTFTFIAVGLMILLGAAGIATTTGYVLGQLGLTSPDGLANIQNTAFYTYMIYVLGAIAVTTVIIGIFSKGSPLDSLSSGIATIILVLFIGDVVSIVNYASLQAVWAGWVVFLLLTPFVIGYIFALWEWVRGRD